MIVKQLEWVETEGEGNGWFAQADTGVYRVFAHNGGNFWLWHRYSWWTESGCILGCKGEVLEDAFNSSEEAKKSAQVDYETRVLSLIDMNYSSNTFKESESKNLMNELERRHKKSDDSFYENLKDYIEEKEKFSSRLLNEKIMLRSEILYLNSKIQDLENIMKK